MEVEDGARTRTRTRSRPATAAKRRKLGGEFAKLSSPTSANSAAEEDRYRSSDSDSDSDSGSDGKAQVSSCCCSNGLSELAEAGEAGERIGDGDRVSVSDLEVDDESTEAETSTHHIHSRRERREMTPSSNLQESTAAENIMPTEFELDEFFAAAEKDVQTRFAEKYNYDISRDAPLEGRFEWVRLKPEQQRNDGVSG